MVATKGGGKHVRTPVEIEAPGKSRRTPKAPHLLRPAVELAFVTRGFSARPR
ncbi:MAG: hypothetical protein ACLRWQ_14745 [Flavonifractor plautii]